MKPILAVAPNYHLDTLLAAQKDAQLRDGIPSAEVRIDRLERCIGLLVDNRRAFEAALLADFGSRSPTATGMLDLFSSIHALKHARRHLRKWMKPEKRPTTPRILGWVGAGARVLYQPKGVVGIMAPWNAPVSMVFAPLAGIFAAGNRAMVKPSELTPATAATIAEQVARHFDPEELTVATGGVEIAQAFSELPFDHLIFTGATSIGRRVMQSAARNLVPVTLELGGKSPVIIGRDVKLSLAAARIMGGKLINGGQICVSPDHLFVPETQQDELVEHLKIAAARMFPTIIDNPNYTSIINTRHYQRIMDYLSDAEDKGARRITINPAEEDFSSDKARALRKIPPTLLFGVTRDMKIMQDEIFGPVLPILTYRDIGEPIQAINASPRPLALYYFGSDAAERDRVLRQTVSGGVTVNDVMVHVGQEDMPFGGVGPSGMGAYHGIDGFREFSHRKGVYLQLKTDAKQVEETRPPYGPFVFKFLDKEIRR